MAAIVVPSISIAPRSITGPSIETMRQSLIVNILCPLRSRHGRRRAREQPARDCPRVTAELPVPGPSPRDVCSPPPECGHDPGARPVDRRRVRAIIQLVSQTVREANRLIPRSGVAAPARLSPSRGGRRMRRAAAGRRAARDAVHPLADAPPDAGAHDGAVPRDVVPLPEPRLHAAGARRSPGRDAADVLGARRTARRPRHRDPDDEPGKPA